MGRSEADKLLYRAIRELQYVQDAGEVCNSGLCATPVGAEIVEEGMKLLNIQDLAEEDLPSR